MASDSPCVQRLGGGVAGHTLSASPPLHQEEARAPGGRSPAKEKSYSSSADLQLDMRRFVSARDDLHGSHIDDLRVVVEQAPVEPVEQALEQVVGVGLRGLELARGSLGRLGAPADEQHLDREGAIQGRHVCDEKPDTALVDGGCCGRVDMTSAGHARAPLGDRIKVERDPDQLL